jgi:hypothetical protein
MTAKQIIEEIKRLEPKEQLGIIRFVYQLDAERHLTGKELSALAERMTKTTGAAEAAMTRENIIHGFLRLATQCLKFGGKIYRRHY